MPAFPLKAGTFQVSQEMDVKNRIFALMLSALAMVATGTAGAEERSVEPERCVQLSRVKSTEVLSNKQIVFELQGNRYFLNTLPYACPGLRRGSTILYRTSLDLLCDVDIVTVLNTFGGGYQPAASCGLGKFEPMDKDEIASLREAARH